MTNRNDLLITAYFSGQIDEPDWQRLLNDEPGLRERYRAYCEERRAA